MTTVLASAGAVRPAVAERRRVSDRPGRPATAVPARRRTSRRDSPAEIHDGLAAMRREGAGERPDARVEGIVVACRDPYRTAAERGGVRDRVVGGERGGRGIGAGVGLPRLRIARPDGRADRRHRGDEVRVFLGEQQRPVAAHRDAQRADRPGRTAEAEALAARDQLIEHHRHRVVVRVRVPVAIAAVDGDHRHRRQRPAAGLQRQPPLQATSRPGRRCGSPP